MSIEIKGTYSYQIIGDTVSVTVDRVENNTNNYTTGSLRFELWALTSPYTGYGGATGYKLAQHRPEKSNGSDQLLPNEYFYNISFTDDLISYPAAGNYAIVLFITEYTGSNLNDGFSVTDHGNFDRGVQFGRNGGFEIRSGGDTVIVGDETSNVIVGTQGSDDLVGFGGKDELFGRKGNDVLLAGNGNDKLWGNKGNDYLKAGSGQDRLFGGSGKDQLIGQSGNDKLFGGIGNDKLFGDGGADVINGSTGKDTLTGGHGADLFKFKKGDGYNVIKDFQNGVDKISIGNGVNSFRQVIETKIGNDTLVEFSNVDILIQNIIPSQIDASDFIF